MGLAAHVKSGLLEVMWQSPLDAIADALAQKVLATVTRRRVRRLFIDGLGGFKDSLVYPERAGRFFLAFCTELRTLGVTTILSDETPIQTPVQGLMAMVDNIICLRHVELHGRVHRFISVTKMRDGAGDSSLHELSIDAHGIHVSATSRSAEEILSGGAAPRAAPKRTQNARKPRRRGRRAK